MAKQYDLKDLGEVYGNLGKETAVLAEDTQSLTVGDAKAGIGSADILPGGPTKEGGFEEPTVDVTKCGDKNPYNVKAYSYGADNDPGVGAEEPAPTGADALHGEEDEEDEDEEGKKKKGKHDDGDDKDEKCDYVDCEDEEVQEEGLGAIAGKIVRGTGKAAGKAAGVGAKAAGKAAGVGAKVAGKVAGKAAAAGAKVAGKAVMGAGKAAIKGLDKAGQIADKGISKLAGDEEDKDEENEESSEKDLEIAQEGLNTFMANKSVFDRLYNKVMVNEMYEMEEMDDLDALGLDDATPDAEGEDGDSEEEVTITLDKDMAKQLCDILKDACGEDDDDVELDVEIEDGEMGHHHGHSDEEGHHNEEDEEGEPHAMNTHYNDGKSNKVGNVTGLGGSGAGSADTGSTAEALHHTVNDGKNNKVGNLPAGKNAFGDVKVQPMNKAVKA